MTILNVIFRAIRSIGLKFLNLITQKVTYFLMKVQFVELGSGFKSRGIPRVYVHKQGRIKIGRNFTMINTIIGNTIGRSPQCIFRVNENGILEIGDNVGMSGTAIVCSQNVVISDNVKIGGNTCIYDTDFHALNALDRIKKESDIENTKRKSVFIGKGVFIGAHVTILKGVSIGRNSIIGACSVVSRNVPDNEIWAGNPAKFIRKIDDNK